MKKIILSVLITFFTTLGFAQNNSLLWEISGNGLLESSYIYGTMHVSKKVAFRLDDVFYEALEKSECVALESDPTQWLEYSYEDLNMMYNDYNGSYGDNFYSRLFKLKPVDELMVRNIIRFDNNLINGYLYRKNSFSDNFEEETYLDMFIFQAGKKNNKQIVGLEDINESRFLTTKAAYNPIKKEPDAWFSKLIKTENPYLLQENVYRERNIALLDSIGSATNTEFYREHMLFKRNENMVIVLDSLMHKKTVFSGVGAAHLAGEKGMLQMLKDRGYTVKPLTSKQTDFAKNEKEKLENLFTKPELSYHSTPDQFIEIKSFDKLREFTFNRVKYYIAPDMTNGAYLTINRLSTYEYLPSEKEKVSLDYIKNLLYEDIPGDIIEKKEFDLPFPGISILNKTKKGDYQKYHIYKTPLEIIVVKFGGKKDFVLNYHEEIFNSIKFKTTSSEYINFTDPLKKYTFKFPEYYITDNLKNSGKKSVQGYVDSDYYFFQESPNHDTQYIEEDDFEAKFIHTNFYKELDIEEIEGTLKKGAYSSYESSAEIDSISRKKIWLKSVVKDGSYYLLGYAGMQEDNANAYFDSFVVNTAQYEPFETVTDTTLLFTVKSPTKAPLVFTGYTMRKNKPYEQNIKRNTFTSKSNEEIYVSRTKFHDLEMHENIDSLWNRINRKKYAYNYYNKGRKKLTVHDEKRYTKNGNNVYTFKYRDSLSSKEIWIKYIQKKGTLFKLSTLKDSIAKPSKFVTEFYESFTPMDSLLGEDIFADKTARFFEALKANDSIVFKGYTKINFNKSHASAIKDIIENHDFPEDKENIKTNLVGQLIRIDQSPATIDFIKKLYENSYAKPSIQNKIISTLLSRTSKSSNELIKELMQIDIPLGSRYSGFSFYDISSDSLKVMKQLYPDMLQYASIQEYKKPVYGLLVRLLDSNIVKPKVYKSTKKQLINDAKIEIKRSLNKSKYARLDENDMLDGYTKLLFPFREEKSVVAFYNKLVLSKNIQALTTYYALLKKERASIPEQLKKETIYNEKAQAMLVAKLHFLKLLTTDVLKTVDLETYAKSGLLISNNSIKKKDSIVLFEKRQLETDTKKSLTVFIFKRTRANESRESEYLHFVAFETPTNDRYNVEPYYTSRNSGRFINNGTTEEDIIEDVLLLIKHKTRKRVSINRDEYLGGLDLDF
ncbi:TraB/GumN family protein [uncultured Psychroserpens sp.]|uniref:TraB/GumN family protein n=1 Tax=uncultured Psychroserpens sp. TaxID=255436 RepID=UPI00260889DD|nr:TraB/GumN family protein [uncultured Psychroserpens sp.]